MIDPLADILDLSRTQGALLASVCAHDPWGIRLPQSAGASFHAITAGTCWLRVDHAPSVQLMPGDVLLLPTGIPHELCSRPDGETLPFDRAMKEERMTPDGDLTLAGPGAATRLVCAGYDYDHEIAHPLLSPLPAVLHLPAGESGASGHVEAIVRLLALEVGARGPGARIAAARLIDLLLVHVVRAWLDRSTDGGSSWVRALRDPAIARVLGLIHQRPGDPWTVGTLAREVHLSRATLSRRFTDLVGEPPLAYLTRWRMDVAARRLRDGAEPVGAVARSLGYSSLPSFNRAFARHRGVPPGRYRRKAAAAP